MCHISPVTAVYPAEFLRANAPNPLKRSDVNMRKDTRVAFRLKQKEKQIITAKAKKCGISRTEYVKQRALGYEPRVVPPDALFKLLEKIGDLEDKSSSEKLNAEIEALLREITNTLLLLGKDGGALSQLQDSGPFTET